MTDKPLEQDDIARAICREQCAFFGEPPCFEVAEWPNKSCNEPGCQALAYAVIHKVKNNV